MLGSVDTVPAKIEIWDVVPYFYFAPKTVFKY